MDEVEERPQATKSKREENACLECLRSSPCASLWGLIFALFGAGAVGGGVIFGLKMLREGFKFSIPPYYDWATYAVVGSTALYVIIAYIIACISTDRNSKRIFDGGSKTKCGRALNLIILIICFFSALLWVLVTCVLWLPVSDVGLLMLRDKFMKTTGELDLSYYGIFNRSSYKLSRSAFAMEANNILVCFTIAMGGAIFIIIGMIQLAVCAAMNYARLEELRYYEMHRDESGSPSTDVQL